MSLPKLVFVYEEHENNGESYLCAAYNLEGASDDERRIIGVYKLVHKREVKKVPKVLREIKVK